MIRVVLDTNVVISALVFPGRVNALVAGWQRARFTWLVSQALLQEYVRVLQYPKFRLTREEVRELVEGEILPFISPVKVSRTPRVIREDPADDHVLACAVAGKADLIVSGDQHLLAIERYRKMSIVTVAEFLSRL